MNDGMMMQYPQSAEDIPQFFSTSVLLRWDDVGVKSRSIDAVFLAPRSEDQSAQSELLMEVSIHTAENPSRIALDWELLSAEEFLERVEQKCYQDHIAYDSTSDEWKLIARLSQQAQQGYTALLQMF